MADLIGQADVFALDAGERVWLDEIAAELDKDAFDPECMPLLSLAAAELRTAPAVAGLEPGREHRIVHQVLARVDALRVAYASL